MTAPNLTRFIFVTVLFACIPLAGNAAITYVGQGVAEAATGANAAVSPSLASGHAANDINLILVAAETPVAGTVSVAGYTQLFLQSNSSQKLYLFCKLDNGGESDPVVSLSGGASNSPLLAKTYAIRGALNDCSSIVAHSVGQNNGTFDLTVEYPALNVTTAGTFVAIAYWHGENNAGDTTPSGFTDTGFESTDVGTDEAMNLKYQIQTTATNVPAGVINENGAATYTSSALVIALKPAASAPPAPLLLTENWDTVYSNYPYGKPDYPNTWGSSSDGSGLTCFRSVDTSIYDGAPGAFRSEFTSGAGNNEHCMIVYHGAPGNFVPGVEYWLGFSMYLEGTWPADPNPPGGYLILWQMHGLNEGTANNPMMKIDATNGAGAPWSLQVLGDTTNNKPYERNVHYTGCGNVGTGQWVHWVMNFRFGDTNGFWKVYKNGTLCMSDTGLNYFLGVSQWPYTTIGLFHGWVSGSTADPARVFYFDQWRVGRAADGVGYSDVAPR